MRSTSTDLWLRALRHCFKALRCLLLEGFEFFPEGHVACRRRCLGNSARGATTDQPLTLPTVRVVVEKTYCAHARVIVGHAFVLGLCKHAWSVLCCLSIVQ